MKNILVWWVTCLIWSSVWLFIKMGVDDVPPIGFAALRLLIALAVLIPIILLTGAKLPRDPRERTTIATTGVLLLGINYGCTYWGAQFVSSGLVAVLQAATPAFGLWFGHYLLRDERFSWPQFWAVLLGVAGVAIICGDQLQASGAAGFAGAIAVAFGGACVALGYVLVKGRIGHLDPAVIMAGQMLCAMVPLLAYGFLKEGSPLGFHWTPRAVTSLLYLALAGSIAAFWLNYWLLNRMTATAVLSMALVEPLIAVLLGAIVLGERVTVTAGLGGLLILASIGMVLRRKAFRLSWSEPC